jgi:uncharacterized protein (UPF0276 family)
MKLAGFGLGLRTPHYEAVLNEPHAIDWLEVITENYLVPGGKPLNYLERIRERFPMVMHGVSLSIGSTDPIDFQYLASVKALAARIEPHWISDHLCWTGIDGRNLHDLLPLPYTEEALNLVVARVGQIQDALGRQLLLENVSSYLTFHASEMSESNANSCARWHYARTAPFCSTSTISTSAASITASTRWRTYRQSRLTGYGNFISPVTAILADI